MAEKCTKTSSPVERWMKPYPFAPLNHFTVPFSLTEKLLSPDHQELSFPISQSCPERSSGRSAPSGNAVKPGCVLRPCCRRNCPKAKDSSVRRRVEKMRRDFWSPRPSALSTALLKTSTCLTDS